jgi:hypothetical protein
MRIETIAWTSTGGWSLEHGGRPAEVVIYFGSRLTLSQPRWFDDLRAHFPRANLVGCSAGSHIVDNDIVDSGIAGVALDFTTSRVRAAAIDIADPENSRTTGAALGRALADDALRGVLVFSDGLKVNGSELARGIVAEIPPGTSVSGGLAADGADFEETLVGLDERPRPRRVVAIGFYGDICLATGNGGGWAAFGPRREISNSSGNVLRALDKEPALDLYERYLGPEDAQALPSSALLYPLKIFDPTNPEHNIVRTVLGVDRVNRTMTFAGDVPQGWQAQLMRGNVDRLTEGAVEAARQVVERRPERNSPTLALMVSCIGRQLLMGQRSVDEVEAANAELGPDVARLGFYSYGEICPHSISGRSELHNQTMTITTISEPTAR